MANKDNSAVGGSSSEAPGVTELLQTLMAKMDIQAQAQTQKMDTQAQEMRVVVERGLESVRTETRQLAEDLCGNIRAELLTELHDVRTGAQEVKEEVAELDKLGRTVREEVAALEEVGRAMQEEMASLRRVVMQQASDRQSDEGTTCDVRPAGCTSLMDGRRHSTVSELDNPPTTHSPPSPPPAALDRRIGRRKPAEFDGSVAWEAYQAQFDMLANAMGWDEAERGLQLVSCLRGPAVEVLGHLSSEQRSSYLCVVEGLQRRFGQQHQAEVYRARLKGRVRGRGEPLPALAQDMESLVRRAYPMAPEDMVAVLSCDHFIHALQQQQLQIYVKQAHPRDLREALARAMELESFLHTTGNEGKELTVKPLHDFRARRMQVEKPAASKPTGAERTTAGDFRGACWGCGERGHMRRQCSKGQRTRSPDRLSPPTYEPCCWSCGQPGHFSGACPKPKDVVSAGNGAGLDAGAEHQPAFSWPRTL